MRDYWLTKDLLQAVGIGYGLLALIAFAIALIAPKTWWAKLLAVLGVGFVLSFPLRQGLEERQAQREQVDLAKERYAQAKALFDKRCETAGEKIYRTVENVEGILLMKVRPEKINFSDQYELDDPYGQQNWRGDGYIKQFLLGRSDAFWLDEKTTDGAYRFVEVIDQNDKAFHWYVMKDDLNSMQLTRRSEAAPVAIYSVSWQDTSTQSDRDQWIACGSVLVTDIKTKEILGSRNGCMFDAGMGSKVGGRSPWAFARDYACPAPRKTSDGRAVFDPVDRNFVEKVLKPTKRD
jgi:membrane protein implicated in regulation of membrane protease activity